MKSILIAAGLGALAAPLALAQSAAVNLAFKPKVGATWQIEERRALMTNQPGRPPEAELELSGALKIAAGTRSGWVYEWKIESLDGGNFPAGADNPYPGLMTGVPVRFTADNSGAPLKIEDSKDLIDGMAATSTVLPDLANRSFASGLGKQLAAMDAKELAATLLTQARLIAACQNLKFPSGDPLTAAGMSPSSDGPATKTTITTTLESAGSASEPAQIHIVEATDPAAGATFSRKADLVCHIDRKTGDVVQLRADITVNAGGYRKRDIREITVTRSK
ncbi:MAG TPA: hypothetical protein VG942_13880 [Hyphomonadaceae bacterium]|nr:hypothetical protein [Hyphomonadaceae bacterium]